MVVVVLLLPRTDDCTVRAFVQVNLRVFWLERPFWFMAVQYTFGIFLLLLVFGELLELCDGWRISEMVLVELVIELKYQLRLRKLQFAAQHGIPSLYQPLKVLKKLTIRLYQVDPSCLHHIKTLNDIGMAIPRLQEHYDDTMRMLKASGAAASIQVQLRVGCPQKLHSVYAKLHLVR